MSKLKKLIVLLVALTMVFASAVPVMAIDASYPASYEQAPLSTVTSDPNGMTVYVAIHSSKVDGYAIDRDYFSVIMTAADYTDGVCYVSDVLEKVNDGNIGISFVNAFGNPLPKPYQNIYGIIDSTVNSGNTTFAPVLSLNNYNLRNGWRFRVNKMFPLLDSADYPATSPDFNPQYDYPVGATISQAYVEDGDYIDLYFADTTSNAISTTMTYIPGFSCNTTTIGIYLYGSNDYYDTITIGEGDDEETHYPWVINSFTPITSGTYQVRIGNTTKTGFFYNGILYATGFSLSKNVTYKVSVLPKYIDYTVGATEYGIPSSTKISFYIRLN